MEELILELEAFIAALRKKYAPPMPIPVPPAPHEPPVPIAPVPHPVHIPLVGNFVLGIRKAEGYPDCAGAPLHNGCDLKYTEYTKSLGAIGEKGGFCIFPDDQSGLTAAQQLVTDAANGKLVAYKPSMTILEFCTVYGEPPVPINYAVRAIQFCPSLKVEDPISKLL